MKTLSVSRKTTISIFTVMLLIYGMQGISYGQGKDPTVTPGETNTTLKVSFPDFLYSYDENAYQIQLRRKSPQGEWMTKCVTIKIGGGTSLFGTIGVVSGAGNYLIWASFTDLEPGTTYEARYRDTNLSECQENPPNPDPWSAIAEGTTHLVTPPHVEFVDVNLARAVRRALRLNTRGEHIELLKIPEAELAKLTQLQYNKDSDTHTSWKISDLTGLEHATQLTELGLGWNRISDITPLAQLSQLTTLDLRFNDITDITPLAQLAQLTSLNFTGNNFSDIMPLAQLAQLTSLYVRRNNISNITPLAQLSQLTTLDLRFNDITDITPLAQLAQLTRLELQNNNITDTTPLTQLAQLTKLSLTENEITDLTGIAQLTQFKELDLSENDIIDVTPLAQLTQLEELDLSENDIIDVTPLAQLTQLEELDLSWNDIIDVTPLAQLTQLEELDLSWNDITDITPLAQLINLEILYLFLNKDLGDITPLAQLPQRTLIHHPSGGIITAGEIELLTVFTPQPLTEATLNGSSVTLTLLPSGVAYDTSIDNIRNALTVTGIDGVTISDITRVSDEELKVTFEYTGSLKNTTTLTISLRADAVSGHEGRALSGTVPVYIYPELGLTVSSNYPLSAATLNESVVTLTLSGGNFWTQPRVGRNLAISGITGITFDRSDVRRVSDTEVTVKLTFDGNIEQDSILIFTLGAGAFKDYNGPPLTAEILVAAGTETPITPEIPISAATLKFLPSPAPSPAVGEQLTLSLNIVGGENVAAYQATVQFDDSALRYVSSAVGNFLPAGAFPLPVDASGNTVTLGAVSLAGENNGDGTLSTITFEVIEVKESTLTFSDVLLSDSAETASTPQVEAGQIVEPPQLIEDVNGDGVVNILDLVRVASSLGGSGENGADVNGDGVVNILDLVRVAGALGDVAAAPSADSRALAMLMAKDVGQWLAQAQTLHLTDVASQRGVLFLEQLLAVLTPKETALLPNYPNPFNPETWIPYRLAENADVTLMIYDASGIMVRRLDLGHQLVGYYSDRGKAVYWDGRNDLGESVASGVYFYHLTAGDYSATRKMLILK